MREAPCGINCKCCLSTRKCEEEKRWSDLSSCLPPILAAFIDVKMKLEKAPPVVFQQIHGENAKQNSNL